ncbi:mitochondrial chaperone BCS1-B [Phytophthora cinnamomi]|uniref:mitochondrial chaperone BCS1-B n=1 Tax=Phytophthora cinnamomi TaxID=4785 RepID=UPI00355AAE56|nr:mitochondrial chaperone BCS1-B [Phytophthora cinnamomi]
MSTSTAFEFGVINTLRTGNAVYDLVVCMVVPAVVQRITSSGQDALGIFKAVFAFLCWLFFPRQYVTHVVETKEVSGGYRSYLLDSESKGNELLQRAILLYLTENLDLHDKSGRYDLLERPNAEKLLVDKEFAHIDLEKQKRLKALLDQPASPEVAKLGVSVLPPLDEWVTVEEGVEFMNETVRNDDEKTTVQETKTLFHLRSKLPDGPERIDAFVEKAFAFYRDVESKKFKDDTSRYMYVRSSDRPAATDTDDESKLSAPYHKRYALGDDKTFGNVFFDEKESLLQLLDHFENKTGKFAIEGFPNKVGLLLYGPPGTGKTSVIKAVAEKTGRHIVNIPLGKVKTNQELMDAMFDLRYAVDGLDLPVRMGFKDVVFVMEDIDCASSVVASREDGSSTPVSEKQGQMEGETPASSPVEEEAAGVAINVEERDDAGMPYRRQKEVPRFFHPGLMNMHNDDGDDDDDLLSVLLQSQMEFEGFGPKLKGGFVSSSNSADKLNLAGVLNVLDGVIDCPGRIVIMTTNHPEMLDPALIRPGRISKKLHLDYMSTLQMEKMIAYYFSTTLTAEQRSRLEALKESDRVFTPADIEELCAEHDSVDHVLERMLR